MAIIPKGDEKFYDAQGNLPSYIQDDLDRVTAEGNVPADPDDYEISGGSGNWTITWSDGTTANTTVRNPLSAANDARLLANAFEARQGTVASTTSRTATTSNGVPAWVDPDYGYDVNNPRKPNMRELTEALAGMSVEEMYSTMPSSEWSKITNKASNMLYGVVGSNEDTRNWNAIMDAGVDPTTGTYNGTRITAAAGVATSQMYGGTTVKYQSGGYKTDANGNTLLDSSGNPTLLPPSLYVVGGNGTVLRSLSSNETAMSDALLSFGVRDMSWVDPVSQAMAPDELTQFQPAFTNLQNSYNPWADFGDMWDMEFTTGISPFQDPFKIISGLGQPEATTPEEETVGVVEQTITAPEAPDVGTTTEVTQPTYEAPQAAEALPASTTPYTPTTVTGQPISTGITGTGVYPQAPVSGTMGTPLQTAGIGSVPQTIQAFPNYTGTTTSNLTTQVQRGFGGQRTYGNQFGQQVTVTVDAQGKPLTYVPPGFSPVQGQNEGGLTSNGMTDVELESKYRIYTKQFGYTGPKTRSAIEQFEEARPEVKRKGMAIGGYVRKFNTGGMVQGYQEGGLTQEQLAQMQASAVQQTMQPTQAAVAQITPQTADFIAPTAGQATAVSPMAEAATVGTVQQAQMPMMAAPAAITPTTVTPAIQGVTEAMQPVTGTVSPEAQIAAAQQATTSVSGMEAAQGTAIMMDNPVQREIQEGELISGAANAEKASQYAEEIQAATATPTKQATVAGQLEGLMQQFEGGETPAWAAGSMRTAMQTLAARGLGASSLAGQAVIQAAMEAALPIAQMDAQTQAQFEAQNLSNRQQRAMLAAQQRATFLGQEFDQAFQARVANASRIADVANMNFNAEQQVALENSRAANTMNLTNLSNSQAMVMAEAAALSQLDMANLNNRQQAAVQNAQNFLQMDMANLSNEQQTAMFKAQQNIQALFTDQAAENAAAQFNAQSENQTNQFFANLSAQTSQFNASQQNAMDQFNVNSVNALREFNSELQQQRDLFNAQNGLVIAQSNAQWRQNIATLNTAAQNQSNMDFAKTINALTASNMDQIWQRERDIMSFAFASAESAADRAANIAIAKLTADEQSKLQDSIGKGKLAAIALDAVLGKWL